MAPKETSDFSLRFVPPLCDPSAAPFYRVGAANEVAELEIFLLQYAIDSIILPAIKHVELQEVLSRVGVADEQLGYVIYAKILLQTRIQTPIPKRWA